MLQTTWCYSPTTWCYSPNTWWYRPQQHHMTHILYWYSHYMCYHRRNPITGKTALLQILSWSTALNQTLSSRFAHLPLTTQKSCSSNGRSFGITVSEPRLQCRSSPYPSDAASVHFPRLTVEFRSQDTPRLIFETGISKI